MAETTSTVALLAEGVDRNRLHNGGEARRGVVALLAEGVDRNLWLALTARQHQSGPPRGGRG